MTQNGHKSIVYVGVIGFQDGLDHLLRALHHLTYDLERTDFNCTVVGDGDALPTMRSLAASLGLDGQITFAGWVDDSSRVASYLREADICVAPEPSNIYNDRSTMIKMMEYMALAKPIVAFDLPEHRFTARSAAMYAEPGSDFDFACQLAALMDDPEQRRKLGHEGRMRVENELAWDYQAQKLVQAYEMRCADESRLVAQGAEQQ